jgi:hypothetical protein
MGTVVVDGVISVEDAGGSLYRWVCQVIKTRAIASALLMVGTQVVVDHVSEASD